MPTNAAPTNLVIIGSTTVNPNSWRSHTGAMSNGIAKMMSTMKWMTNQVRNDCGIFFMFLWGRRDSNTGYQLRELTLAPGWSDSPSYTTAPQQH